MQRRLQQLLTKITFLSEDNSVKLVLFDAFEQIYVAFILV